MKYKFLNLVTALAVYATKVADRLTTVAVRSAEATEALSVKVDTAAESVALANNQAIIDKALDNQVAAYQAYQRCRSNFQDATWAGLRNLAAIKAKHSLANSKELSC